MSKSGIHPKAPIHFWLVGIAGLLWNGFGCYDYVMTNIRDPGYLAQFPPEVMQIVDGFPVWAMAAWAGGVWGALLGSILLLLRSRFAVHAFALSLAGLAAGTAYQATLDLPEAMRSPAMIAMNVAIWAAAILFLLYAIGMRRKGVLA